MSTATRLLCPHCGERPVQASARSLSVRGRLFGHRIRSRNLVGCTRCLRRRLLAQARRSLVHGWSGITAAAVNPFLVAHDAYRALTLRADPDAVGEHLRELGVLGEPGEVDIGDVAYALAASVIHADGETHPTEMEAALEAGRNLLPDFDEERFLRIWERHPQLPDPEDLAPLLRDVLDRDEKEAVLDFLLEIARADRRVDPAEDALLTRVAGAMGLDVREWRSRSLGRLAERMGFGGVRRSEGAQPGRARPIG